MKINKKHVNLLFSVVVGALLILLASLHRTVVDRHVDPTGKYTAEVTYRTRYSFIPMAPGSSSDKPGFVEIFKAGEGSLGRIPVPLLQLGGVQWEAPGALIALVGEWDFERGTCFYWDKTGSRKIYVKGGPQ